MRAACPSLAVRHGADGGLPSRDLCRVQAASQDAASIDLQPADGQAVGS